MFGTLIWTLNDGIMSQTCRKVRIARTKTGWYHFGALSFNSSSDHIRDFIHPTMLEYHPYFHGTINGSFLRISSSNVPIEISITLPFPSTAGRPKFKNVNWQPHTEQNSLSTFSDDLYIVNLSFPVSHVTCDSYTKIQPVCGLARSY